MALRERFSASQFVPDVLRYGVTFWNYVGEPVHYVLAAIEKQYGGDEARIAAEITNNPRNKLRYAVGNGAAPPDIDRFTRWLGLEDMFELYGSTEAAISTFRRKGDPRGSVGEVTDAAVKILDPARRGMPARRARRRRQDPQLRAVRRRDLPRRARHRPLPGLLRQPQGEHRQVSATASTTPATSATSWCATAAASSTSTAAPTTGSARTARTSPPARSGRILTEHPDVALAVAYGVPCAVSDELVMAAIKLRDGARFDPKGFFDWCEAQVNGASMDRKWFPDFVRIVDDFEYTQTQKVLVRNLKKVHFDLQPPAATSRIYWRRRGDTAFQPFTRAGLRGAARGVRGAREAGRARPVKRVSGARCRVSVSAADPCFVAGPTPDTRHPTPDLSL